MPVETPTLHGGPRMAPRPPPTFGAPRHSRVAPLTPPTLVAPQRSRGASRFAYTVHPNGGQRRSPHDAIRFGTAGGSRRLLGRLCLDAGGGERADRRAERPCRHVDRDGHAGALGTGGPVQAKHPPETPAS